MEDDDTHYCLRCRSTIQGLDNYVQHRKEKCDQAKVHDTGATSSLNSYLNVSRGGAASNTLMTRSYLAYTPSKNSRSDPVLSSSSNHMEVERYKNQEGNEPHNSLVTADLSVEVSADDFMNHLGLCMVSSTTWAADINSEEPLRADDFFSLLELQSCSKGNSDRPQRPRRSNEQVSVNGERNRSSDIFPDLNTSHDSATTIELAVTEECLDNSNLSATALESPVPEPTAVGDEISPSSCLANDETADIPDQPASSTPTHISSPAKLLFPSRGKWMPGLKPRDIHKSGSSVEVSPALSLFIF